MSDNVDLLVGNSLWPELVSRKLCDGILPRHYAVTLCETLHLLEAHDGATHTELYREAVKVGAKASGMQWRLACLALIGLVRIGAQRNGTDTWFANAQGHGSVTRKEDA